MSFHGKRIFFLYCFFFVLLCFPVHLFSEVKYFRSNYNGLLLLEIREDRKNEFQFYAKANYNDENQLTSKIIYQEGNEIKRWSYHYSDGILTSEKYYKDKVLSELYYYDSEQHKRAQTEYKNGKKIKTTSYSYNKNGLVYLETISNHVTKEVIRVKYKYDKYFRIKQIIKEYDDGRVIYWDAFFSSKGIITKEYYTLDDEVYIFFYNLNGRELKGEVYDKEGDEETLKITWENKYDSTGIKIEKEEINYALEKKIISSFNKDGKETRVAEYARQEDGTHELELITEYEYDEDNKIASKKEIKGLEEKHIYYTYDFAGKVIGEKHVIDGVLKVEITHEYDGGRTEIIHGKNRISIKVVYDKEGKIISQGTQ